MISIIVPTFNEIKHGYIQRSFEELAQVKDCEVIIIDSFSQDQTAELAKKFNFHVFQIETQSRAVRLKEGIKRSSGETILLHHPRSFLNKEAINKLHEFKQDWGAFTHKFDQVHWLLGLTSYWSNSVRGKKGIYYLDHCIFFPADQSHNVLMIPNVDIFEDTEICKVLKRYKNPIRLPDISLTSAVRFNSNGIFKQAILNQILKIKYYMGHNHKEMNKVYEKQLELNSDYDN